MSGPLHLTIRDTKNLSVTHDARMASQGFKVIGVSTRLEKVGRPKSGNLPLCDDGLTEFLHAALTTRRLTFSASSLRAAAFGDEHFMCGAPHLGTGHPDLSQVRGYVAALAPLLEGQKALQVGGTVALAQGQHPEGTEKRRQGETTWNSR